LNPPEENPEVGAGEKWGYKRDKKDGVNVRESGPGTPPHESEGKRGKKKKGTTL